MLGRLGIRGKIFAVVAVPILVLAIVAGSVAFSTFGNFFRAQNTNQLLTVSQAVHALDLALQDERNAGANFVHAYPFVESVRATAQTNTDLAYADVVAAAAAAPPAFRAQANAALAQVDAIIQRYGYNAAGGFVDTGVAGDDRGLPAVRLVAPVIPQTLEPDIDEATGEQRLGLDGEPLFKATFTDWPEWPSAAAMRQVERHYADTVDELTGLAAATSADTGMVSALTRFAQVVRAESISAIGFLTTPETYLPPQVPEGGVAPPVPSFVATYQDAFLASMPSVDAAQKELDRVVAQIGPRPENADVLLALTQAQELLTKLPENRVGVRERSINFNKMTGDYAAVIAALNDSQIATAGNLDDRTVAEALSAYVAIDGLVEAMRLEQITGERVLRQGAASTSDDQSSYQDLRVRTNAAMEVAQAATARVPGVPRLEDFGISNDAGAGGDWDGVRSRLKNGEYEFARNLGWDVKLNQEVEAIVATQGAVWGRVDATSSSAKSDSFLQSLATLVGGAIIIVGSLIIALLIARRIVGPLRRLTTTATAVRQELPRLVERVALPGQTVDVSEVQIPVESSDEIGRLAEAFNAVNAATLAIAGEQAALRGSISEMFVNVARRDQVLLNRQLASIDEMERSQDDPGTLSKLFALDHLATRMRRNSESLLVLAGIDTGRRMRRPMPLSDVIRTASSEIELYERIQLELDADPSMVGHSALTAGHLFAEILENATVFSDPGSPVVVRTLRKDDSIIVQVVDLGIGMTVDELREANSRVMSTAASEILGAQRLGLFVVGRIARRLGARVEIVSEEGKGATVTVTMPLSLFDPATLTDTGNASDSTTDDELHVPSALLGHREDDQEMDVYSDAVMSPAITGAGLHVAATTPPIELHALIQADAEAAPVSDEVDLKGLTDGTTERGLPSRRRRSTGTGEAKAETGNILGLPERPTTGQLAALKGEPSLGFVPGETGETGEAEPVTAEQRSSMFRGFRARREEEAAARAAADAPEWEPDKADAPAEPGVGVAAFVPLVLEPADELVEADALVEADVAVEADALVEADVAVDVAAQIDELPERESDAEVVAEVDVVEVEPEVASLYVADAGPVVTEEAISEVDDADALPPVGAAPSWEISAGFEHVDPISESGEIQSGLTLDASSVPLLEPTDEGENSPAAPVPDAADEMPADSAEASSAPFSWNAIPPANENPEPEPVEIPADLFPQVPEPKGRKSAQVKGTKKVASAEPATDSASPDPKEKRGLFGRKKKADGLPVAEAAPATEELMVSQVDVVEDGSPEEVADLAPALTDEFAAPMFAAPAATAEFDEWGLPISVAGTSDSATYDSVAAPEYDEWGLPIDGIPMTAAPEVEYASIDLAADALAYELPVAGSPTYDDVSSFPLPEAVAQTGEIPDLTVESLAQEQSPTEPAMEVDSPSMPFYLDAQVAEQASSVDPIPAFENAAFPEFVSPDTAATEYAQPEYAQPEYAQPEYAQPEYVQTDVAPSAFAQPEYAQPEYAQPEYAQPEYAQPEYAQPEYAQQPPAMETYAALDYGATDAPALAPASAIPSFDDLMAPSPFSGAVPMALATSAEIPTYGSAVPDYQQVATPVVFPGLEPDLVVVPVAPQAIDYGLPDMPPPAYGYGAQAPVVESYGQAPYEAASSDAASGQGLYGADNLYGAAAQAFSVDQFAQPYGWEEAGASALAAATDDQGFGGYSPQAFEVTAPIAPDGFEADMTTEVFSELSSLSTARPKVVRTKAGLARRAPTESTDVGPTPIPEIDGKPVERDPEAIRANFSGFYSGTARARGESPASDVHGGALPEVAP